MSVLSFGSCPFHPMMSSRRSPSDPVGVSSPAPASSSAGGVGGLAHPLFSSDLRAASSGAFAHAFSGIAALIDEEQAEHEEAIAVGAQEEDDEDDDGDAAPLELSRSNSEPMAPAHKQAAFTWTRPSAIRIARMRAEAAEREKRAGGEATNTRDRHRAQPYDAARPKTARGRPRSETNSPRTEARHQAAAATSAMQTDDQPKSARGASSESGYGAIRSHARRTGRKVTQRGVASRMSVRTPAELAAERADAASAGETTMLLRMWKM